MADPDSEPHPTREVRAGPEAAGERLDRFLAAALEPDFSRSRIQTLIKAGEVSIGGKELREPRYRLLGGETIAIGLPAPEPAAPAAEEMPLDILFEDEHIVVLDKPAGMVVHPGAGNPAGTLVNALIHHCGASLSGIGGVRRPGIVHRLDKDTSGVMVVAKSDAAHRALSAAFADHGRSGDLERTYVALVWGVPPGAASRIDAPLGRASGDRTKRAVVREGHPDARRAVTHYRVLERFGAPADPVTALVECRLETGRTHQIRVHMAHIGHPLVGDQLYGRAFATKANRLPDPLGDAVRALGRQALHAGGLAFRHPATGEILRFGSPPPPDLAAVLAGFRAWSTEAR